MAMKRRNPPTTADLPLSRTVTDSFFASLDMVLSQDPSVEAQYLLSTYKTKFVEADKNSSNQRRQAAIDKWLQTEHNNAIVNKRLEQFGQSVSVDILPGVSVRRFLDKVTSMIACILPPSPSFDIAYGGFSGGASTSKKRLLGHPAKKFLDKADATRPALQHFHETSRGHAWATHLNGSVGLEPNIVPGNVLFTVPKNSVIDRVACKEPDLNMFFQKSAGNQIRTLLKRVGVNLNDQSINGELARVASINGLLMTMDLSSASDSVCTSLVQRVLPFDWFHWLYALRSPLTSIDGEEHFNEMFSSMGNGFTFELESLLFYSIARATAYFTGHKGRISVYGDDIIAPSLMVDDLTSTLAFCGFSVNRDKSFSDGPFRESCGKHWHDGLDISPFYVRRPFKTISDLILTLNQLTSWSSRCIGVVDPRYEAIILKYRSHIPSNLWGGGDLTSRTSLVTGDSPRMELVTKTKAQPNSHIGGLLFWMHNRLQQTVDPASSFGQTFVVKRTILSLRWWLQSSLISISDFCAEPLESAGSAVEHFARQRRRKDTNGDVPVFLSRYGVDVENPN